MAEIADIAQKLLAQPRAICADTIAAEIKRQMDDQLISAIYRDHIRTVRTRSLLPTGKELAAQEAERAERETERANRKAERVEREAERADREAEARRQAEARAAQMAAKLRELGLDPDQI